MFNLSRKDFKRLDIILFFTLIALIAFGLVVLRSAVNPTGGGIGSQVISTILGFTAILFIFILDLDFIKRAKWFIYLISIGLLASTLIIGIGSDDWGANLWISIGPLNLQPSEISKILHIIFLASFIGDNKKKINTLKFIIMYIILGFLPVGIIVLQRDLGTAFVIAGITIVMLFVGGLSWKNIGIIGLIALIIGLLTLPLVWDRLEGYARDRLIDFSDTGRDIATSDHQTDRGLIALGSGQLTGRGYMQGPFSQNSYIPVQHTDFIFPVLVEDFGFIGGAGLIILYGIMFYRLYKIAAEAEELYHTTLVMGVFALLFVHIFENIGMTMKIMPVTGIPLPFISSGGTFQLTNLILMGFVLSISMHKRSLEF